MKNKIYKIALVLSTFIFAFACENSDDATGDSVVGVSNPSLSVSLDFTGSQSLIESETDYGFTVTLSEPQIAAVTVYLELLSNSTATEDDDLSFPHSVVIAAGSTSISDVISIHADDLAEETETAIIKIGTGLEANVSATNSETVSFSILNYSEGDLLIDMSWSSSTDFTDVLGNAIDDEAIADLVLYVSDVNIPTTQNFLTVDDEVGFESFLFEEGFPDGEFYIVAGFYSAEDFDGNTADLDVTLTFNQPGIINDQTVTIPAALNTANAGCQSTIIAKITKSGTNFSIESVGAANSSTILPADGAFAGAYAVTTTYSDAGGFGAQFDGNVTIVDEGDGIRSFEGDWNAFGVLRTWEFSFDLGPCGPYATFSDDQFTGLGCSATGIYMSSITAANAAVLNPNDDSTFSVTYTENSESDCGGTPVRAEITFTKI